MKTHFKIIFLSVVFFVTGIALAASFNGIDDLYEPSGRNTKFHYFAVAIDTVDEVPVAYLTEVSTIRLMTKYLDNTPEEMKHYHSELERQYMGFLIYDFEDLFDAAKNSETPIFPNSPTYLIGEFSRDKNMVAEKWNKALDEYQGKGYKVIMVDSFYADF